MLISIVTPSFNQAAFLEATMRSVLQQEGVAIEYFVIDGGSTDGSLDIIRRYAGRLAGFVSEPDSGQAEAINKGLHRARGEIFAWLNSDDLLAPGAARAAADAFSRRPDAGLVYGNAVSIDERGRPLNEMTFRPYSLTDLAKFSIICQPAVFARREVVQAVGGVDPSYHLILDHHLWLRIAAQAPLVHVAQVWAFARKHPGAKNVAQAGAFGAEAARLVAGIEADRVLSGKLRDMIRPIRAHAERFSARYLLDAGQAGPAARGYLRALYLSPPAGIREWHRLLFSLLSLIGLGGLGRLFYRLKARRMPRSMRDVPNVQNLYS